MFERRVGNMKRGNRRMFSRESETKAFSAVNELADDDRM